MVGKLINICYRGHNPLTESHKPVDMLVNKYVVYRSEYNNESTTVNNISSSLCFSISLPGLKKNKIMAVREIIITMSSSEMGLCNKSVIERMSHMGFNKAMAKEE